MKQVHSRKCRPVSCRSILQFWFATSEKSRQHARGHEAASTPEHFRSRTPLAKARLLTVAPGGVLPALAQCPSPAQYSPIVVFVLSTPLSIIELAALLWLRRRRRHLRDWRPIRVGPLIPRLASQPLQPRGNQGLPPCFRHHCWTHSWMRRRAALAAAAGAVPLTSVMRL